MNRSLLTRLERLEAATQTPENTGRRVVLFMNHDETLEAARARHERQHGPILPEDDVKVVRFVRPEPQPDSRRLN